MTAAIIVVVILAVFAILILSAAVKVAREYERGIVFRLGRLVGRAEGPGPVPAHPDRRSHGQGRPAHDHLDDPPAGGDHEGQRPGARQRGRLLPDRRPQRRRSSRSRTSWSRPRRSRRPPCARSSASTQLDELLSEREKINAILQEIIDEAPRRGESRSRSSRSRTSRFPATCSARWRGRPRPSESGAQR